MALTPSEANISQLVTTPKESVYSHYTPTLLHILIHMSPGHAEPQHSIPYTPRSSMWPSPLCFPIKQRCAFILSSTHDIRPFLPFFFDHPRSIWRIGQTEKIHIMRFCSSPYSWAHM
jgi:hypothetical protein